MVIPTFKIFVIGGTGAQGLPVVEALVKDEKYFCRVLTRDVNSPRAKKLKALGNVELVEGTFAGEKFLRDGFRGCQGAFVNIDGFNTGEKTEIYWAIRAYELAIEEGVKFYVYGNLDFVYKKSGYDPKFRTGHYDGKGRIAEWILSQNRDNGTQMGAAVFTSGPYIEMSIASMTVMSPTIEDGVVTWSFPLGEGAVVHTSLEDCGYYVRWLFDNQERANGLDLEVGIAHETYYEHAKAFEAVTGHPARFVDVSQKDYWASGILKDLANQPSGYNSDPTDPSFATFKENFTGFLNMWMYSGGNKGVIQRDYKLLDEIHPRRIKSAEEWFRREEERGRRAGLGGLWERIQPGNIKPILKLTEDGWSGKL